MTLDITRVECREDENSSSYKLRFLESRRSSSVYNIKPSHQRIVEACCVRVRVTRWRRRRVRELGILFALTRVEKRKSRRLKCWHTRQTEWRHPSEPRSNPISHYTRSPCGRSIYTDLVTTSEYRRGWRARKDGIRKKQWKKGSRGRRENYTGVGVLYDEESE